MKCRNIADSARNTRFTRKPNRRERRYCRDVIYASEGQPYGVIVGKKLNRTEAGEVIYENGLPTFDDKVSVLGNGNYDFTLGFRNAFSYKNLSMSVLVDIP